MRCLPLTPAGEHALRLAAAAGLQAAAAAAALPPAEELCPGYFAFDANASYWDFTSVGLWSPAKKRIRDVREGSAMMAQVLEQADTELAVLQINS